MNSLFMVAYQDLNNNNNNVGGFCLREMSGLFMSVLLFIRNVLYMLNRIIMICKTIVVEVWVDLLPHIEN